MKNLIFFVVLSLMGSATAQQPAAADKNFGFGKVKIFFKKIFTPSDRGASAAAYGGKIVLAMRHSSDGGGGVFTFDIDSTASFLGVAETCRPLEKEDYPTRLKEAWRVQILGFNQVEKVFSVRPIDMVGYFMDGKFTYSIPLNLSVSSNVKDLSSPQVGVVQKIEDSNSSTPPNGYCWFIKNQLGSEIPIYSDKYPKVPVSMGGQVVDIWYKDFRLLMESFLPDEKAIKLEGEKIRVWYPGLREDGILLPGGPGAFYVGKERLTIAADLAAALKK